MAEFKPLHVGIPCPICGLIIAVKVKVIKTLDAITCPRCEHNFTVQKKGGY